MILVSVKSKVLLIFLKNVLLKLKCIFVYLQIETIKKNLKYMYGIIKGKESVYIFRLFDTSITLPHEDVIVSYTCKMADTTNCDLFLKLEVQAEDGSNQVWILREKEISKPQPNMTVYTPIEMVKDLPNATVSTTNGWATW